MRRYLALVGFLVSACGGGGGSGVPQQTQTLELRVQALAEATAGTPVPILVSVRRGSAAARDYVGVVSFEVEDRSAWYPASYYFDDVDAGQHVFESGFIFPKGVHVLTVTAEGIRDPVVLGISVTLGSGQLPPYTPPPVPGPGPGPASYYSLWRVLSDLHGTNDIALGDFDGDGDLDIVVSGYGLGAPGTTVWLNDGNGSFTESPQKFSDSRALQVACSDVDGDGDTDIVLLAGLPPSLRLWVNRGDGTFDAGNEFGQGQYFTFGDVNGDGYDDLVVETSTTGFLVRANDGKGGFNKVIQTGSIGTCRHRPALADLDGDGDLDLVMGREIWLNDGKGKFVTTGQSFDRDTRAIAAGDMDGDGDVDLILGNYDQENDLYLNDGNGAFTRAADFRSKPLCTAEVALVDLDEDGDLDLIEGNITRFSTKVWLNEGGTLTESAELSYMVLGTYPARIVVGDLNGDGLRDFVTLPIIVDSLDPYQFRND